MKFTHLSRWPIQKMSSLVFTTDFHWSIFHIAKPLARKSTRTIFSSLWGFCLWEIFGACAYPTELVSEHLSLFIADALTLSHLGGMDPPPWETFLDNSKMAQDIKMKFFKFNFTLMRVIFHIMTILIGLRCCHGNLWLWMCLATEKWRNLHICQDIGLILFKFGVGGYFLF